MAAADRAVELDRFPGAMERFGGAMERFGGAMERFGGAMERFGGAGMALLPWTRHMIAVLWDQLRVLVQVIYYTFISVFQMFRFEVHVRITDDPSVTPDPSDPFLFSSLFSEEDGADHTEALLSTLRGEELLSTLRGEELCCDGEGGIFIGHKASSGWTTVGDWNFFVSSSEARSSDEERSASCWSSEEEHLEFDCDESKALWESLSRSGDPYDPFCFSACISTRSKALWDGHKETRSKASWETESKASVICEAKDKSEASWETESTTANHLCHQTTEGEESKASWETESSLDEDWEAESCGGESGLVPAGRFWDSSSDEASGGEEAVQRGGVRRSDSDSSWSSDGSENLEDQEENQLLWDLFTNNDPYNPLNFSAAPRGPPEEHAVDEDELWKGLRKEHDPYHPLNFSALEPRGGSSPQGALQSTGCSPRRQRGVKPSLTQRSIQRHRHPQIILRPWTRPSTSPPSAHPRTTSPPSAPPQTGSPPSAPQRGSRTQKKVRFSDEVRVHVMRSWDFARRSSRRGVWEELARDRDRFRRRIQDSERTVGPCLSPEHRDRVQRKIRDWARLGPGPEEDQKLGWIGTEPRLSWD